MPPKYTARATGESRKLPTERCLRARPVPSPFLQRGQDTGKTLDGQEMAFACSTPLFLSVA
jgi:hypothetical protein